MNSLKNSNKERKYNKTMITEVEEQIMKYIEDNEAFLRSFNNVYYVKFKNKLKGYSLKDYMITSYVKMNDIKGYSNYTELCELYLKKLGNGSIEEGEQLYDWYYETFLLNMDTEVQQLKKHHNKTDDDIFTAYEIKTIWNFYNGFMIEKIIRSEIEEAADYTSLADRSEEEQQYIDDNMAIDIELVSEASIYGLQIKSYTYLGIDPKEQQKHFKKQNKYMETYEGSEVYYVLYKDNKPIYKTLTDISTEIPYRSYLFTHKDILELNYKNISIGSYEGLTAEINNRMWLSDQIKEKQS